LELFDRTYLAAVDASPVRDPSRRANVEKSRDVFRHFDVQEDGYQQMLDDLDEMNQIIGIRTMKE
jgi:hypothetical protein